MMYISYMIKCKLTIDKKKTTKESKYGYSILYVSTRADLTVDVVVAIHC